MIYIQTIDKYWDPGKRSIHFDTFQAKHEFHQFMADEFKKSVKLAIEKQRFRNKWMDLSPGYLAYKKSHGLSDKIWIATGELHDNIDVFNRSRKVITVGFDKRKIHKGSTVRLYKLAHYLEYGTLRIPPRPLFRNIYLYMSRHVSAYYNFYERRVKKMKRSDH